MINIYKEKYQVNVLLGMYLMLGFFIGINVDSPYGAVFWCLVTLIIGICIQETITDLLKKQGGNQK